MGDGPEIPAIRAFSACWTAQAVYASSHTATSLAASNPAIPCPAPRCGAVWGAVMTPLYPALKSTPRFSSAQAPYSSLCRLRQSSLISLRLLSSPRPLRWVVGWFSPHGRNTALSCLRVHGCFPGLQKATQRPTGGHAGLSCSRRSFATRWRSVASSSSASWLA